MDRIQFYEIIYSIVKEIPVGYVMTYGQIAYLAGEPQYARMVGWAMFHAPKDGASPAIVLLTAKEDWFQDGKNKKHC